MRRFSRIAADPWVLMCTVLLVALSWLTVFDAGFPRAMKDTGTPFGAEFKMQVITSVIGMVLGTLVAMTNPSFFRRAWRTIGIGALVLTVIVVWVGIEQNGARRWLGFGPIRIQPSEFFKLGLVVLLAGWYATRRPVPKRARLRPLKERGSILALIERGFYIWPILAIGAALVAIEDGNDMGTSLVILAMTFFMTYFAGAKTKYWAGSLLVVILGALIMVVATPYRMGRIVAFVDRFHSDIADAAGFQSTRAETSIAHGGIMGVGPGSGQLKQQIPAPATDYIWGTMGEEFGLIGALIVMVVIFGLVWRLYVLATRAEEPFHRIVLIGLASWVGFQASMNIMMANAVLPTVGIPIPFLSAGGSSMIALLMGLGLCQSVVAGDRKPKRKQEVIDVADPDHRRGHGRARLSGA